MRIREIALFIAISGGFNSIAQAPAEKLSTMATGHPVEKLYLHCDREVYAAGETIWFKAYLFSEMLPYEKSSVVYVELVNSSSRVISRTTSPVVVAVSRGQVDLPDSLRDGNYLLRAYTTTMLNQDADFVFRKRITVSGKNKKTITLSNDATVRMEFFPEGGNFVTGLSNTIAFKATNVQGYPVKVSGALKNSKDETIGTFDTYHDGMGMMDITPTGSETYFVTLNNDPSGKKYALPASTPRGIVFRLLSDKESVHFEIAQKKSDAELQAAYMIGQMQHRTVFTQTLTAGAANLSGVIRTANLSSGILHITVFNKNGMPLAERLSFIDNKEYLLKANLTEDTVNTKERGRNHFTLAFNDTIAGNFSVSVTDAAFQFTPNRESNILSSLLMTSDIRGYVHNPSYYFSASNDSVRFATDLVMMTNGWTRFRWDRLLKDSMVRSNFKDPGYITLSGRATLEDSKKPYKDQDLMMFIISPDSSKSMQMLHTNAEGYYKTDSVIFFGRNKIFLRDPKGKKGWFIDVKPGADSLYRAFDIRAEDPKSAYLTGSNEILQRKWADEYEAIMRTNGLVLAGITVKSQKKNTLQSLDDKYTTGAFSADSRKSFDLVNSDEGQHYRTVWDYLQAKGLSPNMRNMPTISALGAINTEIYLDEFMVDESILDALPLNQVALIKVYSTFSGSWGGGPGGAIAIYSKKGEDLRNSTPSDAELLYYNGFSEIREFYSPNYATPKQDNAFPDNRITLYWKPDINVVGINKQFPLVFYNNERTKKFNIVVEGMTRDGKLLMIERGVNNE